MFERRVSTKARLLFLLMALFMLSIPTSSQIDNCCFVNQQCETDEEWVAGYYAFHNSQCAAPSVQAPEGSASQQPQIQGYSHAPQLRQNRSPGRQGERSRRSNNNRVQQQPLKQPSSPQVQWETRDWHACGAPCPPPNPGPPQTYTIKISRTDPNKRVEEADDGTPVIVHPELSG